MISINLLPDEFKKTQAARKPFLTNITQAKTLLVKGLIAVVSAAAGVNLLLALLVLLNGIALKNLNHKWQARQSQIAEIKKSKTESTVLENEINPMKELIEKRFSWARPVNQIGGLITSRIWIKRLSVQNKTPDPQKKETIKILNMEGCVASKYGNEAAAVAKFIKALQDNKEFRAHFEDIRLGPMDKGVAGNVPVMNFKVSCYFKKEP